MSWQEALHEVQQSSKLDPENPSRVLVNDKGRGDNFLNDTIKEILCSFVTLIGSYFATYSPSPPPVSISIITRVWLSQFYNVAV